MARDLHADFKTEVTQDVMRPVFLIDVAYNGGTVYMWSGLGDITYNSNTYTGVGDFLGIAPVEETSAIKATGINITLSGIPSAQLSNVLSNVRTGKAMVIYLAFVDESYALVNNPYILFQGLTDIPEITETGETSLITFSAESRLIDLQRARLSRYTDQEQQQRYSGDVFFEYVPTLQNKDIKWGR